MIVPRIATPPDRVRFRPARIGHRDLGGRRGRRDRPRGVPAVIASLPTWLAGSTAVLGDLSEEPAPGVALARRRPARCSGDLRVSPLRGPRVSLALRMARLRCGLYRAGRGRSRRGALAPSVLPRPEAGFSRRGRVRDRVRGRAALGGSTVGRARAYRRRPGAPRGLRAPLARPRGRRRPRQRLCDLGHGGGAVGRRLAWILVPPGRHGSVGRDIGQCPGGERRASLRHGDRPVRAHANRRLARSGPVGQRPAGRMGRGQRSRRPEATPDPSPRRSRTSAPSRPGSSSRATRRFWSSPKTVRAWPPGRTACSRSTTSSPSGPSLRRVSPRRRARGAPRPLRRARRLSPLPGRRSGDRDHADRRPDAKARAPRGDRRRRRTLLRDERVGLADPRGRLRVIRLYDGATGALLATLADEANRPLWPRMLPDGRIVMPDAARRLRIFDADGREERTIELPPDCSAAHRSRRSCRRGGRSGPPRRRMRRRLRETDDMARRPSRGFDPKSRRRPHSRLGPGRATRARQRRDEALLRSRRPLSRPLRSGHADERRVILGARH